MAKGNRRSVAAKKEPSRQQKVANTRRGATESSTGKKDLLNSFIRHHAQLAKEVFNRLLKEPVQTLMTALVIAIALGLPAFFYLAVVNLQSVGEAVDVNGQVTVFLQPGVSEARADELSAQLTELAEVVGASYISPEQALAEFRQRSGLGDALDLLDGNPLPGVLVLLPDAVLVSDAVQLSVIVADIQAMAGVDDVMLDMRWLERLNTLLLIAEKLALSLGLALALGVLLIVGNTIRLEIENRKSEIVVVKLVGGTDAFVRRPFLYTGVWYGLIGGVLSWVLVGGVFFSVDSSVSHLAGLYQSSFQLEGISLLNLLALAGLGAGLGLLGSFIAVARHLSAIEPT